MHLETSSNLYGVTVSPFNNSLTPGGSFGGEGALLGLNGSCLGIGTDIGMNIPNNIRHSRYSSLWAAAFALQLLIMDSMAFARLLTAFHGSAQPLHRMAQGLSKALWAP